MVRNMKLSRITDWLLDVDLSWYILICNLFNTLFSIYVLYKLFTIMVLIVWFDITMYCWFVMIIVGVNVWLWSDIEIPHRIKGNG